MVLERRVPFLEYNLLWGRADLGCDKFLEVSDRVIRLALDFDLLAESVVATE